MKRVGSDLKNFIWRKKLKKKTFPRKVFLWIKNKNELKMKLKNGWKGWIKKSKK